MLTKMPPKTVSGKTVTKRKKKANPKGKYIIHSLHTELPEEQDVTNYVSFDPGANNFDIRFESRRLDGILTLKQAKYVIPFERTRISTGTKSRALTSILEILDSYEDLLRDTHVALMEDQMCINNDMMYLMTAILTYFLCKYPKMFVVSVSSKLKGINLGAPPKLTRDQLKDWGEDEAKILAIARGDRKFLRYLEVQSIGKTPSQIKIDDSTDNLIQIEAFCIEAGYRTTSREDL